MTLRPTGSSSGPVGRNRTPGHNRRLNRPAGSLPYYGRCPLAGPQPDGALRVDLVYLLLGDPRLLRHVDAAGEDPVRDGRHREADERGDVAAAQVVSHDAGVEGGTHERGHREEPDPVRGEAAPPP